MSRKIAIVTGGSLGLGREVARQLKRQGYKVALFGRGRASLDEAVEDLGAENVFATQVDVGDEASVIRGFEQVDKALGPVDTLVNSAAIFQPFAIEDTTAERLLPLVNTNFCGIVYTMRQAIARMRAEGTGGDIVNVSSESVRQSTPFFNVYSATKAALERFTTITNEEVREDNIRCTNFRAGRMLSHGAASINFAPELVERFIAKCDQTGALYWSGAGMEPSSVAMAMVNMLATPRDARVELMEIRSH